MAVEDDIELLNAMVAEQGARSTAVEALLMAALSEIVATSGDPAATCERLRMQTVDRLNPAEASDTTERIRALLEAVFGKLERIPRR